jgi:hypothetical protein
VTLRYERRVRSECSDENTDIRCQSREAYVGGVIDVPRGHLTHAGPLWPSYETIRKVTCWAKRGG